MHSKDNFIPNKVFRFVIKLASVLAIIYLLGRAVFTLLQQ